MSQVYVGTAYHQVYCVPLCPKTPIIKLGQKKRCPVTSIFLPSAQNLEIGTVLTMHELQNIIYYSDPFESFSIDRLQEQQQIQFSQKLPAAFLGEQSQRQKILGYEIFHDKRVYYTSHGNMYYHDDDNTSEKNQWNKLYFNDVYADRIKSLPKQGVGKLRPEYTCVKIFNRNDHLQVAFAGRGVLPFVYEANQTLSSITWKAKNPTNDQLDLQVPIDDVDLCFLKMGCHLACLHALNKLRVYDVKSRRRKPILDVTLAQVEKAQKSKLTKLCVSKCENYFYVANARGSIYELDAKKNYSIVGKFKGITTTIKDMQISGDKLVVLSLDGYLRIFNIKSKEKQFERYLNTHPEVLKLRQQGIVYPQQQPYQIQQLDLKKDNENEQKIAQAGVKKVKKIRKRNKVGLKYIRQANLDRVKLENQEGQQNEEQMQMKEEENINKNKVQFDDQDLDL